MIFCTLFFYINKKIDTLYNLGSKKATDPDYLCWKDGRQVCVDLEGQDHPHHRETDFLLTFLKDVGMSVFQLVIEKSKI